MPRALPIAALLASACGGADHGGKGDASAGAYDMVADSTGETTVDTASAPTDTAFAPDADWYAIDGQLEIVGGTLLDTSGLQITLLSASLDPICVHTVGIDAIGSPAPPVGEPIDLGWWRLQLQDGVPDAPDCPEWQARDLFLGVGPYDPRLDAALAVHQAEGDYAAEQGFYGLYLREFDGAPLYVVGVVWMDGVTEDALATAPPLPDGTYSASSLLLMAF